MCDVRTQEQELCAFAFLICRLYAHPRSAYLWGLMWTQLSLFLFFTAIAYSLHQNEDEQSADVTVNSVLVIRELRKHGFS